MSNAESLIAQIKDREAKGLVAVICTNTSTTVTPAANFKASHCGKYLMVGRNRIFAYQIKFATKV